MIRQPIELRTQVLLGVGAFFLLLLSYSWISYRAHQENPKDKTLPNLSQFVEGWGRMLNSDDKEAFICAHAWASFKRLFLGVVLGVFLAFLFGMTMGCINQGESFCLPPIAFFAKIPPTAMLAVYFVFFGVTGIKIFAALIALGIFPTLAQSIAQAARKDVTDHAIYKSYTLGASHLEVVCEVLFKQILPRILENIRLQIGPAMVFLIAAEWSLADEGFGYVLRMQSRIQNMNIVYTYLVVLGCGGLLFDWSLTLSRRKLAPWFGD